MPAFAGMTGDGCADPGPLSRAALREGGLQAGEVFARSDRAGMVRPEARLENHKRAADHRLGLGEAVCDMKQTMRASARLLFAIAFIGGMDNAALAGSRASLADLLGQGYEVKATSTLSLTD